MKWLGSVLGSRILPWSIVVVISLVTCRPKAAPPVPSSSASAAPVASVPPSPPGMRTEAERNTIGVFKAAAPATVFVTQTRVVSDVWGEEQEVPAGSGSGFVWDTEGHIVTNFHVVQDAKSVTVTLNDQQTYDAQVVGTEPKKDIAVLKIDVGRPLTAIKVARSVELEVGQKTIAIGNPFGLDHTLTEGIVSALGRQVQGIGHVTIRDMIQTDAAINPGNSGGPLLDSSGQLIGMNTMIYSQSGSSAGIGFAVPVSTIARVVPQIIKTGHAEQVGIGISADTTGQISRRIGRKGVVVVQVPPETPAGKAGIKGLVRTRRGLAIGDIIVGIDNKAVNDFDELYTALDAHKAGDTVSVSLRRGETDVAVDVKLVILTQTNLI